MSSTPTRAQLTLNPNATSSALVHLVRDMSDRVAFGLRALENYEPTQRPTMPTDIMPLMFHDPEEPFQPDNLEALRAGQRVWLLQSGFSGFIRGVSAALQEARVFCTLAAIPPGQETTLAEVRELIARTRKSGLAMHVPKLLEDVERKLSSALELSPHILSFNKVRNCLEHRHGVVSSLDCNDVSRSSLVMEYRRQRMVWVNEAGEEIPLVPPMVIDGGTIVSKVDEAKKVFPLGQRVEVSIDDFNDVAFTCFAFALNLAAHLPKIQ